MTNLGYAVGHNFRNETCSGTPVVANIYAKDNKNALDEQGFLLLQVEYDYYLVGKKVVLWANLTGQHENNETKVGIGRPTTLRGLGLTGEEYSFAKGFNGVVRLYIHIKDTSSYYKNANFGVIPQVTGDDNVWSYTTSMANGITSCINHGMVYVDVKITDANNSGTVSLTNLLTAGEF